MKKITLKSNYKLIFGLTFLLFTFISNAQCIRTSPFGNITSNNSGVAQNITTCAYSNSEYSTVSGLIAGEDYVFSARTGSTSFSGSHIYVTITDASNTVIQHGMSPQTVTNITATTIRIHYSDDAACAGQSNCHNSDVMLLTTCIVPSGLTSSNVTTTGATIAWTAPTSLPVGGFDYYYSTSNVAPTGTTTPSGNVANTLTSVALTGLTPSTQYFYWFRSNCTTENSVWSASGTFTTLCTPFAPPYLQDFTTYVPSCWEEADNGDITAGPATFGNSGWNAAPFGNNGSVNNAVKYNLYLASANDWLLSPFYTIPASGYELRFLTAATQFFSMNAPTTPWEADDSVEVLVSTGTTNWTVLYTINNSNVPSNTGDIITIDLDSYANQTVRFAFRAIEGSDDGSADIDLFVDNFEVRQTPSCPEPQTLVAVNLTTTSADIGWTEMGTSTAWNVQYGPNGFALGTGTTVAVTTNPYTITGLTSNTTYCFYVQANCGGSTSLWSGPYCFTTLCDPFGNFTENFDTTTVGGITNCWSELVVSADAFADVETVSFFSSSNPNSVQLYNSNDATAEVFLITPNLTALDNGTHRLKFRASGGTNFTLIVGTMTNPAVASTFTEVEPLQVPNGYMEYIVNFSNITSDNYIAFKHGGGGTFRSIYIDDVVWEPIPTVVPGCATTTAIPHPTCGNFATNITWPAVSGADGYKISIGSTTGGVDLVNEEDLGNVLTYSYTGNFNSTYFYKVVPYNFVGNATGCTEQSYTTFATGCYCTSLPTSNDGAGITNVQLGTTNFPTTDVTYFDHTATAVNFAQGINSNVVISFATGFTYNTYIWIDFNNNLTFEASELVYTGESPQPNPSTLNASFIMPATAALGNHRMRIVTADFLPDADPCYSGSWGVTLDFTVNIITASCTPPAATATVSPDCTNNQFFVNVDVTALGSGTPSITAGGATWPVTATGIVQVGPFANGTSVVLTAVHGTDSTCDLPLGSFVYNCPPLNDNCSGAVTLTAGGVFNDQSVISTTAAATNSTPPDPGCAFFQGGDVWFSVVVPASGSITLETNVNGTSTLTDSGMAVYSGSCSALTLVECDDDDSLNGAMSLIALTGQTPGATLYVNVWRYGGGTGDSFRISAYDASLSASSFDNANFVAYPNPVNDVLNISYSSEIASVKVINLLGQEVLSKNVKSTSTQLNTSSLQAGTYLVQVLIDDYIKTLKIVKE